MNWRYWIGKSVRETTETLLRWPVPLRRYFPSGSVWPFDVRRFYERRNLRPQIILDAGANVGQTCLYLRRWFPEARIFSFEPVQSTYEVLARNTARYSNIRCHCLALGDGTGSQSIRLMSDSLLNTLTCEPALDARVSGATEIVRIVPVPEFCRAEGIGRIDLLKMDVQGYELPILRGAADMLERVAFIYAEVGLQERRADQTEFGEMHEYLRRRGFFFCGFYDSFRHWDTKLLVSFSNALYVNPAWFGEA